jgi:excisionase family DNA binding protein
MEVSIPEAARLLGISEHTVRRRLRSGELKGTQVANAGGFAWVVQLPDGVGQVDNPSAGELIAMKALIARLEAQVAAQEAELEARCREVQGVTCIAPAGPGRLASFQGGPSLVAAVMGEGLAEVIPRPRGNPSPQWRRESNR